MTSDDVFRSRLESTIASLRYWVPQIADVARIEESQAPGSWRIAVTPKAAGACPFELVLRTSQHYDLAIAGETYEDLPIDDLGLFLALAEAISEGRVVQRHARSAVTGATLEITSIVTMPGERTWSAGRKVMPSLDAAGCPEVETASRHFLPYHR